MEGLRLDRSTRTWRRGSAELCAHACPPGSDSGAAPYLQSVALQLPAHSVRVHVPTCGWQRIWPGGWRSAWWSRATCLPAAAGKSNIMLLLRAAAVLAHGLSCPVPPACPVRRQGAVGVIIPALAHSHTPRAESGVAPHGAPVTCRAGG